MFIQSTAVISIANPACVIVYVQGLKAVSEPRYPAPFPLKISLDLRTANYVSGPWCSGGGGLLQLLHTSYGTVADARSVRASWRQPSHCYSIQNRHNMILTSAVESGGNGVEEGVLRS